jgi:parvulin-like peptidyl-prolyl isomerase
MDIAIVNDYRISDDEYKVELMRMMKEMQLETPSQECKMRALQYLIDGILILQKARKSDAQVSNDAIQNRLLELMMEYQNADEFYSEMARRGINEETIRNQIRDDLLVEQYVRHAFQADEINITEEQLVEFYNQNTEQFMAPEKVRASHILLSGDSEDNRQHIYELRERIHSPEDFVRYVEECSDCPSVAKCGDLGYFTRGMLIPELENAAFALNIDEISEPVHSDFGWHLIMVTDRRTKEPVCFEQIKDQLRDRLRRIEAELRLFRHLKQLRAEADVIIHEVYL